MTFGRIVTVNQTVISCKQANLFEYINSYIKISQSPAPSCTIVFFTQNNWSNFLMIFISWSRERGKLILRNYFPLTVFPKRFIVDVWISLVFWIIHSFHYISTRICFWFWICQVSGYVTALNMPSLHRVLNTLDYAWMCLNLSEWLLFYIYPL